MTEIRGEIRLQGFDELAKALMEMPENLRTKVLKNATRKATQIMADDAGDRLGRAGSRKDMAVSVRLFRDGVKAVFGPRQKNWVLKFREFGTSLHKIVATKKRILADAPDMAVGLPLYHKAQISGKQRFQETIFFGKEVQVQMQARPFIRPAFDAKKQSALDELGRALRELIERAVSGIRK